MTVVTGMPNHPSGVVPPAYRGRVAITEDKDGIRVLRSWVLAAPNDAGLRKLLGHLSFAATSLCLSGVRLGRQDVVIASSPTLFMGLSAWIAARLRGARFVFEVRDLWPDAFVDLGVLRPGRAVATLRALARFLYRRADLVVTVTESFAERIRDEGIDSSKIRVITNGADVEWFGTDVATIAGRRRSELGLEDRFVVAYIGAHGVSHGLGAVLDAAERCRDLEDVRFLFVGDGSQRQQLERERSLRGLDNVVMLPQQPWETIREFYALADVCLVPLRDIPLFDTFIPSKMFEIMASSRPIIGSVRGESRRILERSGAAVVTDPEASGPIADAVRTLRLLPDKLWDMGVRGRRYVVAHYSRQALASRYLTLLEDIAR